MKATIQGKSVGMYPEAEKYELTTFEKAFSFLRRRKIAYLHTFNTESVAVKDVLRDLATFCRAEKTCFHKDERVTNILLGRHEVWLRIQQHLHLTEEELYELLK